MNVDQELFDRRFARRLAELSQTKPLSEGAQAELREALQTTPDRFELAPADAAFAELSEIEAMLDDAERTDEYKDDDAYFTAWNNRVETSRAICNEALARFPHTVDAQLILAITNHVSNEAKLKNLEALAEKSERVLDDFIGKKGAQTHQVLTFEQVGNQFIEGQPSLVSSLWANPFARPHLRVAETLMRAYVNNCNYRLAQRLGEHLLELDPEDNLQVRNSLALVYARLEDEKGLGELQAKFGNQGTPWTHLAAIILLYKQERMPAFNRALTGFVQLYESAAFALLRPTTPPPQILGRATVRPGGLKQLIQAVSECEGILADCPDLLTLVSQHEGVKKSASAFAKKYGFDF